MRIDQGAKKSASERVVREERDVHNQPPFHEKHIPALHAKLYQKRLDACLIPPLTLRTRLPLRQRISKTHLPTSSWANFQSKLFAIGGIESYFGHVFAKILCSFPRCS